MSAGEVAELLKAHNWKKLTDAYGSAAEVPSLLRKFQTGDRASRDEAYDELYARLAHQGVSRSEASAAAAPFLIWLAEESIPSTQVQALRLLASIAIGDVSEWLNTDLTALRAQESLSLLDAEADFYSNMRRWALQAYDAVKQGIPAYIRLLGSDSINTCLWSAYLLGWFQEEKRAITPALISSARARNDEQLTATVCIAAGMLGDVGASAQFLTAMLESGAPVQRSAGAIGLALLSPELDGMLLNELAACAKRGSGADVQVPYGSMSVFASMFVQNIDDTWVARPGRLRSPGMASPEK